MTKILTNLCATLALTAPGLIAGEGDRNQTKLVTTTLSAIRQSPESYKGVSVKFPVQFASVGRVQNPFFTRFVASDYANLWCWADEQMIWRKDHFDDLFALLFVNKESKILDEVIRLKRYDRVMITGVVRNTFQGTPWIEVTGYQPLEGKVGSATLSHMYRGENYMTQRKWSRAISELSLAPTEGVPAGVRAVAHRDLGTCYLRLGEHDAAFRHLTRAVELTGDVESTRLLTRVKRTPGHGLDRKVKPRVLGDHERPLWEAFTEVAADSQAPKTAGSPPAAPEADPKPSADGR